MIRTSFTKPEGYQMALARARSDRWDGRTGPGNKVTNAGPGQSWHQHKVAFDFVPVVAGKAVWDDAKLWATCGAIARECGLEWGGSWKFTDKPHCQNTQGKSINDALAGAKFA